MRGVRKCCICNAVDGTDDDMLWNGITEVGNVRNVCVCVCVCVGEEHESTDCEDEDSDTGWYR